MNVLITGATDGIGLALAHDYQRQGARLILIGRRPLAMLDPTFFTPANYCQVDLAQTDCATQISLWLHKNNITRLDLVIQNAALGYVGPVAEQMAESIRQLIAVNLWAPIALSHALLPLVAQAGGKIVFISSVAVALPGPNYAVYSATKAALDGFVRNLQIELAAQKSAVRVQVIHPGATRTAMHAKSGASLAAIGWERFPTAEVVAHQIAQAITGKSRAAAIGPLNQVAWFAGRHLAAPVDWVMGRRQTTDDGRQTTDDGRQTMDDGRWTMDDGRRTTDDGRRTTDDSEQRAGTRHCVITGAADGIGRALAHAFAAAGYAVTGIDVDADRSAQTQAELAHAAAPVRFLQANLADANAIEQTISQLAALPPIDFLIHNAGINAVGAFTNSDLVHQQAVVAVNFVAPLLLTAGLLRQQRLTTTASLVFIASLSHFVSYPGAAVYAASKDGITAYARSLAVAIAPQGMHVLTVFPGPTRTAHARRYSPDNRREQKRMAPEQLARLILQAVERRRRHLIPGLGNQVMARLGKIFPHLAEQAMRRAIFEKLG